MVILKHYTQDLNIKELDTMRNFFNIINIWAFSLTNIITVTNKDLCRIPAGELKLKTKNDLDHLGSIAEEETISEHPRGSRGMQVGVQGCERRYRDIY